MNPELDESTGQPSKRAIAELSIDAQLLINRLNLAKPGDFITYEELNQIIGGNVQGRRRGTLTTARRVLIRKHQMVFEVVFNEGIKRLEDSAIAKIGMATFRHIHRTSKRATQKMACADYEHLTNDDRIALNTQMSMLGALAQMTRTKSVEQLELKVREANEKLPLAKTLAAFTNGK